MKLIHITTVSESLTFLRGQLSFFREHGLDVIIVSRPDQRLIDFAQAEGITAEPVPMERKISPVQDLGAIARLMRVFRSHRPAIVHAHTPKGGLLGMIAAWLMRVPVRIYHIRGLPYMGMAGRKRTLMKLTERVSCALATEVFCVSHGIASVAKTDRLVRPEKIRVFLKGSGNGVDAKVRFNPERFSEQDRVDTRRRFGIPADAKVVLFVGRLANDKGIRELAAAWQMVSETTPAAHLLIVGSEDERDPADPMYLNMLRSNDSVHFAGYQAESPPFYAVADLLVLPTYREGFPNVLLEAAAMGVPAIASDIPGCQDAIEDGLTGTIIPVRDATSLGNEILRLLADESQRKKMRLAARVHALENYDQKKIWAEILKSYERLLHSKGLDVGA